MLVSGPHPPQEMFHKSRSGEPLSSPPPRLRNQLLGPLLVPPQLVEHPRELGLLVRGGRGDGSGAARRRQLRRGLSLRRGRLLGLGAGSTLALSHLGLVRGEFLFRFVIKLKVICNLYVTFCIVLRFVQQDILKSQKQT